MRHERGAAPVDAVFGIVVLLVMVLGVMQLAFTLYGRNVIASSAHEGARAVVELGRDPADADAVARSVVERAAGGLVQDLDVRTVVFEESARPSVRVTVDAQLRAFGPLPWPVRVSSSSSAALPGNRP